MSNFSSPHKLGGSVPKTFDGFRKARQGEKKPDLYFTYHRLKEGGIASFEAEGRTYMFVTLWWKVGNDWLVQRFYPISEERMTKEFVEVSRGI